jgi:hypothetical protein
MAANRFLAFAAGGEGGNRAPTPLRRNQRRRSRTSAVEFKIDGALKRSAFRSKRAGALYVGLAPHALLRDHVFELGHPGNGRHCKPSGIALTVPSCVEYRVGKRGFCGVEVVSCEAACLQKNFPRVIEGLCEQAAVIRIEGDVHAFHGGCPTTLTVTSDRENLRSIANLREKNRYKRRRSISNDRAEEREFPCCHRCIELLARPERFELPTPRFVVSLCVIP